MTTHQEAGRLRRSIIRSLLAVVIGAGLLLTAAAAASQAASAATSSGTVTYTAQLNIPAPPVSNFAGSSGGDGWGLAFTPAAVYNVYHHSDILQVACHLQTDASQCWSTAAKTITDGGGSNFATSAQPGLWIDQKTGDLYVYATRTADSTAGVVCIDTTQPASVADPFCGFTPLSAGGDAPLQDGSSISGTSDPVVVGTNWYSFNYVTGAPTGTEDQLLCFSLTTFTACPAQPYAVPYGSGTVSVNTFPAPAIANIAGQLIVPMILGSSSELACFSPATDGACAGSWPISTTSLTYPEPGNLGTGGGTVFPLLDASGSTTGFCIPIVNDPCFDTAGDPVTTPAGLAAAVTPNAGWDGAAVVIGARVYVPGGTFSGQGTQSVNCYDYSAGATCANFPKALSNLSLLYTVNVDPQRPTCLWVNSDGQLAGEIQNFDAYTGGPCGQGPIRVLAASIVAPGNVCIPANYTSLQVTVPARNQYTSGSVQFEDFNGDPLPTIPNEPLDSTGSVDLTPLDLSAASPLPQFLITLNGAGSPPEVDVKLTWVGQYSDSCVSSGQTVTGGQGYRLGARDGGVFDFGQSAYYGSMTGKHLNGPEVGIASTTDGAGYWLAASDGGVFAFGDATFDGSLGANAHLNAPIVGIASDPAGSGYWLVGADGGVFSYGSALFHGVPAAITAPIVGIAATPSGNGYWLVGSDGNVYPFGDAVSYGSEHGKSIAAPIVGIASSNSGKGYTLVGADGGVFAFGDAPFYGSMVGKHLAGVAVGITVTPSGQGYWLDAADGGVFAFGDAQFLGCMVTSPLNAPLDSIGG